MRDGLIYSHPTRLHRIVMDSAGDTKAWQTGIYPLLPVVPEVSSGWWVVYMTKYLGSSKATYEVLL